MAEQYVIEQGTFDDNQALIVKWRERDDGSAHAAALLDWYHAENAPGLPLVQLLRHVPSAQLVGTASAGARCMLWQGKQFNAGVLFDLTVAPDHRSLGPALMLTKSMIDVGAGRFKLLYSCPTPQAIAIARRAGHVKLAELVRYARVLRHARYLSARMPGMFAMILGMCIDNTHRLARQLYAWRKKTRMAARWVDQAEPEFDTLWQQSDHGTALVRVHDAAMAGWRLDASPFTRTRYLLLSDWRSGALRAWFACREDGAILHVDDAWTIDGVQGADRAAVNQLLMAAWTDGRESVSFSFAGPSNALRGWTGSGFVERGRRPVFGRWLDGVGGGPQDVFLTAADEDQ